MSQPVKRAHPALWVPSLYFAMGTPMVTVSAVSAILYKNLGLSNAQIAFYTGSMYLPWVIKRSGLPSSRCSAPRSSSSSPWSWSWR